MGQSTPLSDRYKIKEMLELDYSYQQIADSLGISASTVKKWRKRIEVGHLDSTMGRPSQGALSSYPAEITSAIHNLRKSNAGWGPITIREELQKLKGFSVDTFPSSSSIGRYLKEKGLAKPYERNSPLPCDLPISVNAPHDLWQLDAEGSKSFEGIGQIAILNAKDICSKAHLVGYPAIMLGPFGHPTAADYQVALRYAFTEFGLPKAVQVDHASVFYDNRSKSPFPQRFHLWLVALDIKMCFSRVHTRVDQF